MMHGALSSSSLSRLSNVNPIASPNGAIGGGASNTPIRHSVDRSSELLACARTALQIFQHEDDDGNGQLFSTSGIKGSDLRLYEQVQNHRAVLGSLQKDALQVLKLSDSCLKTLSTLVRRRGHTNDPTLEMQQNIQQFQTFMKELHDISTSISTHGASPIRDPNTNAILRNSTGKQRKKHYDLVAVWLQNCGKDQTIQFQKAKDMRGEVLKAQVRRRKLLEGRQGQKVTNPESPNNAVPLNASTAKAVATGAAIANSRNISKSKKSQMNSPLFTMTTAVPPAKTMSSGPSTMSSQASLTNGNGYKNRNSAQNLYKPKSSVAPPNERQASSSAYGSYYGNNSYNGSYGNSYGGGYGGGGVNQDGMRRRNTSQPLHQQNQQSDFQEQQQYQQQQYSQGIKTRQRLEEARKAERSIAELTQVFGKMASLVSAQGEVLENIEYDVENSYVETDAASKEIGKLYDIKKGNRGLILKTFAILIFMIIFMRFF